MDRLNCKSKFNIFLKSVEIALSTSIESSSCLFPYNLLVCHPIIVYVHSSCFRLLWTCVILSCGIYLTVSVVQEIKLYYRYPTTGTQYTKSHNEIEFPSVTICNLNSLNKSTITNDSSIDKYYFSVSPLSSHLPKQGFYLKQTLDDVMKDHKKVIGPGGLLESAMFDFYFFGCQGILSS